MQPIKTQKDIKGSVNIRQFTLAKNVKKNGPEVAALRTYVRQKVKDISIIQPYLDNGTILEMSETHNLIVDAGLEQLAMSLSGERSTVPQINYGALGTGTPNVIPGATTLVTEAYRKAPASLSHDGGTIYVDFFFAAGEFVGTATEFGNFIDGTATADTGNMFSYIGTGGWVVGSAQSLYVSCEYNITNA